LTPLAPFASLRARLTNFAQRLARDKADTLLLLGGAVLVLAPHAGHLPLWVSALCAITLAWRTAITLRGSRLPPPVLLLPLAAGSVAGVYLTYHTILGRDAGVAMLVMLVAFKMLEMRARRDLFVVIFLCFFLLLTTFFYAQGIGTALMMGVSVVALFSAQLSFQFSGVVPPLRRRLWLGARTVMLAAPLALLLFFVFPRIQGPLWGMPQDAAQGRTGLSNSMAPGNLSSLAQSDETAFRVQFLDPAPSQAQLYWRGVVLGSFDGRSWTQIEPARRREAGDQAGVALRGRAVRHQVTLEPSGQRWLFALDLPEQLPQVAGNRSVVTPERELVAAYPIDQRVRYAVSSHPFYSLQADARLADAERWLALPDGFNPRALAAGAALRQHASALKRINTVLRRFHAEGFSYTLEPPLLGRDSIDEFLYQTRSGFCEHYASAFVFLMRAAGVPARVVTGYQGGAINPVDGFLTVRQSDAHAWAEVWLAGRGWLRVDPTAAVAPERVQRSLAHALPRKHRFGIEALDQLINFDVDHNSLLAQLRYEIGAFNNGWNQWVLNYTPERQRGVLESLIARLLDWRMAAALALGAALAAAAHAWRVRRRGDPVDALYSALCLHLARLGLARSVDEGPNDYRQRLDKAPLAPHQKHAAAQFLRLYSAYKYGPARTEPGLAATLKNLLTRFR
jgi:transglutaminase-like putative cysteine protease